MAQMTIILRRDPASGKQTIVVKLDSDPDALPIEHEQQHKALVEKLIGMGINPDDANVVIEREQVAEPSAPSSTPNEPEKQKTAQGG
jgi:Fe2+ transport system protein FeoA